MTRKTHLDQTLCLWNQELTTVNLRINPYDTDTCMLTTVIFYVFITSSVY